MHDEDQFANLEEELVRRPAEPMKWYPQPMPNHFVEQEPQRLQSRPVPGQRMHTFAGNRLPSNWLGNYKKDHDPDVDLCLCCTCYTRDYPHLRVGDPVQVHPAYPAETLSKMGMAGLYDSRIEDLAAECYVCHTLIELGGAATRFDQREQVVVHVSCLPKEKQEVLRRIGYGLDYLIGVAEKEVSDGEKAPDDNSGGAPPACPEPDSDGGQ